MTFRIPFFASLIARLPASLLARRPARPPLTPALLGSLLAGLLASGPLQAVQPPAAAAVAPAAPGQAVIERWLRQSIRLPDGQRLRIEVEVGRLSPGLKLAACDRTEPFVPGHGRLWGRTTIGLRCTAGARWTTYLPVRIAAFGPALVARTNLPAGRIPQADDFVTREVDWAASRSVPLANAALLRQHELLRPIAAGRPVTADDLRMTPAVRAGEPVAVVVAGQGFTIGVEAVALSSAADGQRIQVRTGNGKVLTGQVDGRIVRISR